MAWNPSPEVAVARDAAKALNNAPMCVVLWITDDNKLGMPCHTSRRPTSATIRGAGKRSYARIRRCFTTCDG